MDKDLRRNFLMSDNKRQWITGLSIMCIIIPFCSSYIFIKVFRDSKTDIYILNVWVQIKVFNKYEIVILNRYILSMLISAIFLKQT